MTHPHADLIAHWWWARRQAMRGQGQDRRVFVDMDGVLADFDGYYHTHFGVTLDRHAEEPPDLWTNIQTRPNWFDELPVLPGALAFWRALGPYRPTLLSGISQKIPDVAAQKRRWVDRHLGRHVPLITTKSSRKRDHGQPGDILVDDWTKYRHRWEQMGGIFVVHDSLNPMASVRAVRALVDL